ncbi:hypothetical protein EDB92DRAFT_1944100 [Lactarius akahatsu]|uniref:Uncharacterized protein n=1 Tax=Lactarius akahatsu TaxID=416441 RepID=A0AAD4LP66_9AGAM|nr:hypothetical protein EDB92DRAFT_1944100 [Lactarius akahatsu]
MGAAVNDGRDTTIDFIGQWVNYWLALLLDDTNFNDNRTKILLTSDETETYTVNLTTASSPYYLGVPTPRVPAGPSTRPTLHRGGVSARSAVDALEHLLHRQRDRPHEPQRLHHRHDPGPAQRAVLRAHHGAEHVSRRRAGGGSVSAPSCVASPPRLGPAPENLTAQGGTVPWLGPRVAAASSNSSSGSGNGAAGARKGMVGATVLGALLAGVVTLLLA